MSEKFQIVGSLLRPADLLQFKRAVEQREDITYPFYHDFEGYQACEQEATKAVIKKQIEHGIEVISDGEYSKSLWHLDFVWGLTGITRYLADHGYFFQDQDGCSQYETRKDIGLRITGQLSGKGHHFIEVYRNLKALAGEHQTKLCIPSPSHIFGELSWSDNIGRAGSVYPDTASLKVGLTQAYQEFITEYAAAGGTILQLDDCLWELFAEDNPHSPFTGETVTRTGAEALAAEFIELNNTIIAFGHQLGLKMWTHNCRGNYDSRNMGGGSYANIAELFLKQLDYDRFFLEWDDDRAGSLAALQVFQDKPETEIVLGLLSSKTNTLDEETRVFDLLAEAAQLIGRERLFLSHQCGFASCDSGNELTEQEQWNKIDQGQRIAKRFWGK